MDFVDQIGLQEVAGELAAAHEPNILAGMFADLRDEAGGGVLREDVAGAFAGREGARENIHLGGWREVAATHFAGDVVGFASEDVGVNGGEERGHGKIFGHEQEVEGAVGAGDVAVETHGGGKNDFAHGGNIGGARSCVKGRRKVTGD
jgi:hypothetical protein